MTKKLINGLLYDTEAATFLGELTYCGYDDGEYGSYWRWIKRLYRTEQGHYFFEIRVVYMGWVGQLYRWLFSRPETPSKPWVTPTTLVEVHENLFTAGLAPADFSVPAFANG